MPKDKWRPLGQFGNKGTHAGYLSIYIYWICVMAYKHFQYLLMTFMQIALMMTFKSTSAFFDFWFFLLNIILIFIYNRSARKIASFFNIASVVRVINHQGRTIAKLAKGKFYILVTLFEMLKLHLFIFFNISISYCVFTLT